MPPDDRHARFTEIYDAYSGLILAYAARRTDDRADAADVLADTFAVAWRRIDDVPDGEEARPWLYGVARKVLSNHHRSDRRRRRLSAKMAAQAGSVVASAMSAQGGPQSETIRAAFSELSESDQELLTLVAWEQLDREEIAQMLGTSRAVVRVRLHRARRRLEKALQAHGVKRSATGGHGSGGWATALPDPEESR